MSDAGTAVAPGERPGLGCASRAHAALTATAAAAPMGAGDPRPRESDGNRLRGHAATIRRAFWYCGRTNAAERAMIEDEEAHVLESARECLTDLGLVRLSDVA